MARCGALWRTWALHHCAQPNRDHEGRHICGCGAHIDKELLKNAQYEDEASVEKTDGKALPPVQPPSQATQKSEGN